MCLGMVNKGSATDAPYSSHNTGEGRQDALMGPHFLSPQVGWVGWWLRQDMCYNTVWSDCEWKFSCSSMSDHLWSGLYPSSKVSNRLARSQWFVLKMDQQLYCLSVFYKIPLCSWTQDKSNRRFIVLQCRRPLPHALLVIKLWQC